MENGLMRLEKRASVPAPLSSSHYERRLEQEQEGRRWRRQAVR